MHQLAIIFFIMSFTVMNNRSLAFIYTSDVNSIQCAGSKNASNMGNLDKRPFFISNEFCLSQLIRFRTAYSPVLIWYLFLWFVPLLKFSAQMRATGIYTANSSDYFCNCAYYHGGFEWGAFFQMLTAVVTGYIMTWGLIQIAKIQFRRKSNKISSARVSSCS